MTIALDSICIQDTGFPVSANCKKSECIWVRLSIKKILFPVQRVAKIEASRAAVIFFFFFSTFFFP